MRVFLHRPGELDGERRAVRIVDAFGYRDDAAAEPVVHRLDLGQEFGCVEAALGQINQVRAIVLDGACGGGCGGQESGVAAHHDGDVNARQRAVVEVGADECLGHEARRRGIAWRVVAFHQVVVDGLGDVDAAQVVAFLRRLLADDAGGLGRVVAADVEEPGRVVGLQRVRGCPGNRLDRACRGSSPALRTAWRRPLRGWPGFRITGRRNPG